MSSLKQLIQKKAEVEAFISERRAEFEATIEAEKEMVTAYQEKINAIINDKLAEIRKLQSKEFGAVNITLDGYKVTETIPKKVKWDQDKLFSTFTKIVASGDEPTKYMKMELTVPEKLYDAFDPQVRSIFDEARTVEKGPRSVKIEEVK